MENLFLFPILFLVVSCSSNKMEKSEQHQEITTDPLLESGFGF